MDIFEELKNKKDCNTSYTPEKITRDDVEKLLTDKESMIQDKLFDNVEAFHRAMRGKKVRHVAWPPEWFVSFDNDGVVVNEINRPCKDTTVFFDKSARENDWEEYEE